MGNGNNEVWNCHFERNYHRSISSRGIVVTGITQAASAVVTAVAHGIVVGKIVQFNSVVGMTQINGLEGTVTAVGDADHFTVNINSSAFSAYTSGGSASVKTTAAVSHYANTGTATSYNHFDHNDIGYADGFTQNSSGSVKYYGIDVALDNNTIVSERGPLKVIAQQSVIQSLPAGAQIQYDIENLDTHSTWDGFTFLAPGFPLVVDVTATVTAVGGAGAITADLRVNNVVVAQVDVPGGTAQTTAMLRALLVLGPSDILRVHCGTSAGVNSVASTATRLQIRQEAA
jgi:hypothetical protein